MPRVPLQSKTPETDIDARPAQQKLLRLRRFLYRAAGVIFVLAGGFKLSLLPAFTKTLDVLNVPFPALFGSAISLGEVVAGILFVIQPRFNLLTRLAALFLVFDMMGAIALIGWRGANGQALQIDNHIIGSEPWRLPLEIVLLLIALDRALRRDTE